MKTHELKTWPEHFQAVLEGRKPFEWRKDDGRNFEVGDHLHLREYRPTEGLYTGRELLVEVTHIVKAGNFEIPPGYTILGIRRVGHVGPIAAYDLLQLGSQALHALYEIRHGRVEEAAKRLVSLNDALWDLARERRPVDDGCHQRTIEDLKGEATPTT